MLYSFTGGADGGYPYAVVVEDWAGNLYGTTCCGGASRCGSDVQSGPAGQRNRAAQLYAGGADGGYPYGSLIIDFAGNLYGDASNGGTASAGVVFKVDPQVTRR